MSPRQLLGRARRRYWRVLARAETSQFSLAATRRLAISTARRRSTDANLTVLVAPPVHGNNGDLALCQSFIEHAPRPVLVVTRHEHEGELLAAAGVRTLALPGLLYGGGFARRRAQVRLSRELRAASALAVMGADVMDGRYNLRASMGRAQVARLGSLAGVPSRVLGFSWNATPNPLAERAIVQARAAGVLICSRDPVSHARLEALGVQPRLVADLVFSASTADDPAARSVLAELGVRSPFAIVNASGLVGQLTPQVEAYAAGVRALQARGLDVLLLPHVARASGDDLGQLSLVKAIVGEQAHLLTRVVAPEVVRGLCGLADVVVTGRMHVSVMSFWAGTPPIVLSTQGKVEGLVRLFDAPELMLTLDGDLAEELPARIDVVLDRRDDLVNRIHAHLPEVRALSRRNFDDL